MTDEPTATAAGRADAARRRSDDLLRGRSPRTGTTGATAATMSEKEALERVQAVIYKYRLLPHYTEWAIAAMVLDALRWPRSDGTVPDA